MTHRSDQRDERSKTVPANLQPASILVLSSPSGGGKTTQRRFLLADDPNREFLVSYTTRLPRPGEVDGVDYHFLRNGRTEAEARAEFQRLMNTGEIFEHTDFYSNLYGTPRKQLEDGLAAGKQLIADVNLEGLKSFKQSYPNQTLGVFIEPPSLQAIKERLEMRVAESLDLSPVDRQRMQKENQLRLTHGLEILSEKEDPAYDRIVHQIGCTAEETYALLKTALAPLTKIEAGSIRHFYKQTATRVAA